MKKYCLCEDYKKYMPVLDDICGYVTFRPAAPKITKDNWKIIEYCPWCGEKLKIKDEEEP